LKRRLARTRDHANAGVFEAADFSGCSKATNFVAPRFFRIGPKNHNARVGSEAQSSFASTVSIPRLAVRKPQFVHQAIAAFLGR